MKILSFAGLLVLLGINMATAQVIDSGPSGIQNYRAVQGGGERVKIDINTPLPELIKRLEKPWQFVETGKMYWIGYTDDMYSIAAHGDAAIRPLLDLISSTNNTGAKIGAIYTIHLIGIDRKIVGRFYEEFNDIHARSALLSLLTNDELAETAMSVLQRDPWASDVPSLFSILQAGKKSDWYIVNSLKRYELAGIPIGQAIPANIDSIKFNFPYDDSNSFSRDYDFDGQIQGILHSLKNLQNPLINIEGTLFRIRIIGRDIFKVNAIRLNNGKWGTDISAFLSEMFHNDELMSAFAYDDTGHNIQYYVSKGRLYICSSATATKILLDWWTEQSGQYKAQFTENKSAIRKRVEEHSR